MTAFTGGTDSAPAPWADIKQHSMTKEVIFMKGRKTCSILCAAALALSLTACGNTAATDSDQITEQTLTGQITAIDGSSVTLQLGELSENAQTPPEMPGGSNSDDNSGTPPEMPSGAPSGSSDDQSGQTPPEKLGGDSSSDNGGTPPEMPSGEAPSGMGGSSFTAGDETTTLDFSSAELTENGESITVDDLAVGNVVTATVSGTTVTAAGQTLDGDIIVDTISTLTMTLRNGSVFTGTVNIVDNAEGGSAVSGNAVITVESGCTWNLTGDCTVTSLANNGTINFNGYTITLADGTVLR